MDFFLPLKDVFLDCSQSLYLSVGFSRLVRFDRTPTILVYNGERSPTDHDYEPPLRSLDTLPRLRSPLQTKMAGVRSKRTSLENPTEK